jgi:transglutaminase-like putative cysteine protease
MKLAPIVEVTQARMPIANGHAGIFQTVARMRAYVDECKTDPQVMQAAISVVYGQPEKDRYSEARALFEYVRDHVRYVQDVAGMETLADPRLTLRRMVGDCDDQSTLLASLLESVGYSTRFVVAGYSGPDLEHVYLQVLVAGQWIDCDPTEHHAFGWAPPDPTIYLVEGV